MHRSDHSVLIKCKLLHCADIWKSQVNVAKVREQGEGAGGKSREILVRQDKPLNLKFYLAFREDTLTESDAGFKLAQTSFNKYVTGILLLT